MRTRTFLIGAILALLVGWFLLPAILNWHARAEGNVGPRRPIEVRVKDIKVIPGKTWVYVVRYEAKNPNPFVVTIPVGPNNRFVHEVPDVPDQRQPTVFAPGKSDIFTRTVTMQDPRSGLRWSHPTFWYIDGQWLFAQGTWW